MLVSMISPPHFFPLFFLQCILEALDGRTRILVTHRLNFVPQADMVVVLEAGRIVQCGTYASLMHQRGDHRFHSRASNLSNPLLPLDSFSPTRTQSLEPLSVMCASTM